MDVEFSKITITSRCTFPNPKHDRSEEKNNSNFVSHISTDDKSALEQLMSWRRIGARASAMVMLTKAGYEWLV